VAAATDALLDRLTASPGEAGLFLDFDGVLAPIVARPADAHPPEATRAELARLAARYALVAVVSGRSGEDVRTRVGVDGVVYVGSHGLELDPRAEVWRRRIAAFAEAAEWPAAEKELKGLTVSFHFRSRPDESAAISELEELAQVARGEGLVARFGRKLLEVLPPVDANKGTAVRRLLDERGLSHVLVAGDDTTDLDAFLAVEDVAFRVRVAVLAPESPRALAEHAELVVPSTEAFLELLRRL
jgi:trehalose 6-phosphate phosphatase